ncbi:hypothetical protein Vqi01_37040 [Micromonospora qiuiae]|uniref:DUF4253 domain-containing protein n=2 Tax=Micromonospora qiuiae TaxID=502268 RepID=A0ABQ4JEE5_9ACTN|nr:hypothetical protein Vqi01_37040 [Micromonospora qiuiae]
MPADLVELFADEESRTRTLTVPLPPGRTVRGDEGDGERPVLWVSNGPAPAGLWPRLHAAHVASGLWPLLLDSLPGDPSRPWDDGELWPDGLSSPAQHDPRQLLADWWASYAGSDDGEGVRASAQRATDPYGRDWPGLAPAGRQRIAPRQHADHWAEQLVQAQPTMRLGLVAASRGSDALTTAGWQGALNYTNDTGKLAAVLRSWEDRFGVRVIGVGFAELYLSVAAPPKDLAEALPIAAEHFAFCPDNIWQGQHPHTLGAYADRLVDAPTWAFWWD